MLIAEVSQRRIIATVLVVCFIFSSCFSVLSETAYAASENLGKQGKDVSEDVPGDVEKVNYFLDESILKYIPFDIDGNKGIVLQTEISSVVDTKAKVEKEEINIDAIKINDAKLEKVLVNDPNKNAKIDWNFNEKDQKIFISLNKDNKEIGNNKFLVTYIYRIKNDLTKPFYINSKVNGSILMSGKEIKTDLNKDFELKDQIGNVISLKVNNPGNIQIGNLITNSYSSLNNYKTNYETEIVINIPNIDLVNDIEIKDLGNKIDQERINNVIYKQLSISKENFDEILGSEGYVEIYKGFSEVAKIDSSIEAIDNEYKIDLEDVEELSIRTSKPIKEGNLIIKANKEIGKTNLSSDILKTSNELSTEFKYSIIKAGNVRNELGTVVSKIALSKPVTKPELKLSRNTLSTISENNLKLTVVLNNTKSDEDLYKNPKFVITMPKYVTEINVENISLASNEEVFKIKNAYIDKDEIGALRINVILDGEQTNYNLNTITNGTNVVIDAKVKLDNYTPSGEDVIRFNFSNEKATSYINEGKQEVKVKLDAPVGVISVNKISNYNNLGSVLESVEQGKTVDKIEVFADSRISNMDILVMNNNKEDIENVKVLGRIPFKGNKDVNTGKDLGTTVDTKLVSNIVNTSNVNATIYYSKVAEATEDLNNKENGWMQEIDDLSQIKSYLIVINEKITSGQIVKFSYSYEIPEGLEHNNSIFGTFKTIYEKQMGDTKTEEVSSPDLVGLTTGIGPQIKAEVKTNVQEYIKEYEKVKYAITIENTGSEIIKNAVVKTKIPERTTLATHSSVGSVEVAKGWTLRPERELTTRIPEINPGETKKVEFFVQVNKMPSVEEYYASNPGFVKNDDGTYSLLEEVKTDDGNVKEVARQIDEQLEYKISSTSEITADDLSKAIKVQDEGLLVKKAELVSEETIASEDNIAKVGETVYDKIKIKNNSNEVMKNIQIVKVLPKGFEYSDSYVTGYEKDGLTVKKIRTTRYNQEAKTITWTIDELMPGRTTYVNCDLVVGKMDENVYKDKISTVSTIRVNNEEYQAGQVDLDIGRPALTITQKTTNTNEYIKVGEEINYIINVKNIGSIRAEKLQVTDILPNEVKIKSLSYVADNIEVSKVVSNNEDATVYTSILPGNEVEVKIGATIKPIESKQKTIENKAEVKAENIEKIQSNDVTNVIENTALGATISTSDKFKQKTNSEEETPQEQTDNKPQEQENKNVKSRYEVKGLAWIDQNKNGSRDQGEKLLSGLEVKLIKAESGDTVDKLSTNSDGEYVFSEIDNGTYSVIFYYDASRFGLTDYKKNGISDDKNSDAVAAKENGINIAATDVIKINNGSVSHIDIGLTNAEVFDLSLTKTVTKITVQNSNETKVFEYDKEPLAKVDIRTKDMIGSKVVIEYNMTVKNEGQVEGYAKSIVDYLPNEMQFSTELNPNWYKGNDGNLYTTKLADKAIGAGESEEVKLLLTMQMTGDNNGIFTNTAEIKEDYNKQGYKDVDSIAGNKELKEDDLSTAEIAIGVKTGETIIYFSLIIAAILVGIATVLVIKKNKLKLQLRKKGV